MEGEEYFFFPRKKLSGLKQTKKLSETGKIQIRQAEEFQKDQIWRQLLGKPNQSKLPCPGTLPGRNKSTFVSPAVPAMELGVENPFQEGLQASYTGKLSEWGGPRRHQLHFQELGYPNKNPGSNVFTYIEKEIIGFSVWGLGSLVQVPIRPRGNF